MAGAMGVLAPHLAAGHAEDHEIALRNEGNLLLELPDREAAAHVLDTFDRYFDDPSTSLDVPLALEGTDFQRTVWAALREIPVGETRTYSQLAREVGSPKAIRATGHANGSNPVSIIVPCHRLVGADGALRGYAGGLDKKRWLLDHEIRVVGADGPAPPSGC